MNNNTLTAEVKKWWTRKSYKDRHALAEKHLGISTPNQFGNLQIRRIFKNRTVNKLYKILHP